MEIELATFGITFKHGKPYHPQTQGKVERYHLTLKKWLRKKPAAATLAELQAQIDRFVHIYNEERPHTARGLPTDAGVASPRQGYGPSRRPGSVGPHQGPSTTASTRPDASRSRYRSGFHHVSVGRADKGKRLTRSWWPTSTSGCSTTTV